MAETFCDVLVLDQVVFIPAYRSPHKRSSRVKADKRIAMVRAAVRGNDKFIVSDFEVKRTEKSYSIITAEYLKKKHTNAKLYSLIGADSVENLHTWRSIEDLEKIVNFVVVDRPSFSPVNKKIKTKLINMPAVGISSTDIRRRLKLGKSIRYLVPDAVLKIIKQSKLY
jgi:nicotinate-nucleotide adenylyltransferase